VPWNALLSNHSIRIAQPQPCHVHPLQMWLVRTAGVPFSAHRGSVTLHADPAAQKFADIAVRCADGHFERCFHMVCAKQATRFKSMRSPAIFVLCSLVRWPAAAAHVFPCSTLPVAQNSI